MGSKAPHVRGAFLRIFFNFHFTVVKRLLAKSSEVDKLRTEEGLFRRFTVFHPNRNFTLSSQDAFKQLSTGKDNLVLQTSKLKDLGLKNKKALPPEMVSAAVNGDLLAN